MSPSSAANALQPEPAPGSASGSAVYVHFMSGEVARITPATSVIVQPDIVLIYDGAQPVASYPRKEVFSCSLQETSPSFT